MRKRRGAVGLNEGMRRRWLRQDRFREPRVVMNGKGDTWKDGDSFLCLAAAGRLALLCSSRPAGGCMVCRLHSANRPRITCTLNRGGWSWKMFARHRQYKSARFRVGVGVVDHTTQSQPRRASREKEASRSSRDVEEISWGTMRAIFTAAVPNQFSREIPGSCKLKGSSPNSERSKRDR